MEEENRRGRTERMKGFMSGWDGAGELERASRGVGESENKRRLDERKGGKESRQRKGEGNQVAIR